MTLILKSNVLVGLLENKVKQCLALAEERYRRKFEYQSIQINIRGRAAGQIRYQNSILSPKLPLLRFNPYLLEKYGEVFIDQVAPHECAHLVVHAIYGFNNKLGKKIRPHGREWKAVMLELYKLEPVVTHKFEVQQSKKDQYIYLCQCSEVEHCLSIIRHNKVMRGQARYLCKRCREGINYKEVRAIV